MARAAEKSGRDLIGKKRRSNRGQMRHLLARSQSEALDGSKGNGQEGRGGEVTAFGTASALRPSSHPVRASQRSRTRHSPAVRVVFPLLGLGTRGRAMSLEGWKTGFDWAAIILTVFSGAAALTVEIA